MERQVFIDLAIVGYAGVGVSTAEEDAALAFAEGETGFALETVLNSTTIQFRGYRNRFLYDLTFQLCQKSGKDFAFKGASHNQVFENYKSLLGLFGEEWLKIKKELLQATVGVAGFFTVIPPGYKYRSSGRVR